MTGLPAGDPAFATIKARVIARTGHHYYADKDDQLWERVAQRMAALSLSTPDAYLLRLDDPAHGSAEWEQIESAVTINETFFFRFEEQFAALRTTILPSLIAARRGERRLRIWSVGCSTGAEPYSVAILLHRLLGPALADWRVSILGTDIDGAALAIAREGLFGAWALRTVGAEERDALFVAEGARFRLKDPYRAMVRFERQNMLALADGGGAPAGAEFDLILCRNVLIYFHADVAIGMVAALAARLRPDGYLLLGHAEPGQGLDQVATPIEVDGIRAYRPQGQAVVLPVGPAPRPSAPTPVRPPKPRQATVRPPQRVIEPLAQVRHHLATGDLEAAVTGAERATALSPRDPVPHYLAALGHAALDRAEAAERAFRRALYLDPGFAMAHYLLGRQLIAEGRAAEGRRALANAARVAAEQPGDAALPEGDGMTADELAAAVSHGLNQRA